MAYLLLVFGFDLHKPAGVSKKIPFRIWIFLVSFIVGALARNIKVY